MNKAAKILLSLLLLIVILSGYLVSTALKQNTKFSIVNFQVPSKNEFLVKRVVDGDTIELESGQKVRYIGINTPETVDPKKPAQCFGEEAKEENKKLVEGKIVELVKDVSETDKYGRLLRYVYQEDTFINDFLVRNGYAQTDTAPPDVKYQQKFLESQRKAHIENLGLWNKCQNTNQPPKPSPVLK